MSRKIRGNIFKCHHLYTPSALKKTGLQRMPGSHLFCHLGLLRVEDSAIFALANPLEMGDRGVLLRKWRSLDLDKRYIRSSSLFLLLPPSPRTGPPPPLLLPACFHCGHQWARISQQVPEAQPEFPFSLDANAYRKLRSGWAHADLNTMASSGWAHTGPNIWQKEYQIGCQNRCQKEVGAK